MRPPAQAKAGCNLGSLERWGLVVRAIDLTLMIYRLKHPLTIQITTAAAPQITPKPTIAPSAMPPGSGPVQVAAQSAA